MAATVPMPLQKGVCWIYFKLNLKKKIAKMKLSTSETYCRLLV